jgi:hypothetical protein
VVALVLIALPIGGLSWIAVAGLALYILLFTGADLPMRRGAIILLAVTVPMFWSRLLFQYFANFILEIDASLVATDCSARHIMSERLDAQAASTMTLTSNMPIPALSHPTSWTVPIALAAMPFAQPRKKSPAKNSLRSIESRPCVLPFWLTSAMIFRLFESQSGRMVRAFPP